MSGLASDQDAPESLVQMNRKGEIEGAERAEGSGYGESGSVRRLG